MQHANNYPAMSAIGTALTSWRPARWTIEAAIHPDNANNGYQTVIGRDSQGAFAGENGLAALYFSVRPNGVLALTFIDAAGNKWNLDSAANAVASAKWQAIAASSDGKTLSLYSKNITDGATSYTLLGALDISSSANSSLTLGAGDGSSWDAGVITVGRGLYGGNHTDRFFGYIDDVRLTQEALAPAALLYSAPTALPSAPAAPAASASGSTVALSWPAVGGATSYYVKRATISGGPYAVVGQTSGTSHNDAGLSGSTAYYYVVSALNANGEGTNSPQTAASLFTVAQSWRQTHFGSPDNTGDAADSADPDADGVTNLLERAFAGDPNAFDASILPRIDPASATLSVDYRKAKDATDLNFEMQESTDLATWSAAAGTMSVIEDNATYQVIRHTRPIGADTRLFLRLSVAQP